MKKTSKSRQIHTRSGTARSPRSRSAAGKHSRAQSGQWNPQPQAAREIDGGISVLRDGSLTQWQRGVAGLTTLTGELLPLAQKGMGQAIDLMVENGKAGAELVRKTLDAARTPPGLDGSAKWIELWTSSVAAARTRTEAASQFTLRAMESWMEFFRKQRRFYEELSPAEA